MEKRNKDRSSDNTTISVSLSKELKAQVEVLSKETGIMNKSALIRHLIANAVKKDKSSGGGEGAPQSPESEVNGLSPGDPIPARPQGGGVRRANTSGYVLRKAPSNGG
jgi:hypothetical protein